MKTYLSNTAHQPRGTEQDRSHIQQKTTRKTAITGKEHMHQQTIKNQSKTNYSQSEQSDHHDENQRRKSTI
jgi:hypothetical protein